MNTFLNRCYMALCWLMMSRAAWAQDYDDMDMDFNNRRRGDDEFQGMDEMMDAPFPIGFDDVVLLVFLLLSCYVFGKIWKGCTYIILVIAVAFYVLARY